MIVVDTNVVAYLLLPSSHTAAAERLLLSDRRWVAPALWRYEFANNLWMHVRHDGLDRGDAERLGEYALGHLRVEEREPRFAEVLATACELGLSAYDAQFVVLAETLGAPLYTFDRKILRLRADLARRPE